MTEQRVRDAITAVQYAWEVYERSRGSAVQATGAAVEYEIAVRSVGALIAAQVDDEISARLGEFDDRQLTAAEQNWLADRKLHQDRILKFKQWQQDAAHDARRNPAALTELKEAEKAQAVLLNQRTAQLEQDRLTLARRRADRGRDEGQVTAEVLGRYRPYGGHTPDVHTETAAHPRAMITQAVQSFPDAWMSASDEGGPLLVKETEGRAHYRAMTFRTTRAAVDHSIAAAAPYDLGVARRADLPPKPDTDPDTAAWTMKLNPLGTYRWVAVRDPTSKRWFWRLRQVRGSQEVVAELLVPAPSHHDQRQRAVTVHEMSHRVETLRPEIPVACKTFRQRRTSRPDGEPATLTQFAPGERAFLDHFTHMYGGKDYEGSVHTEVLSMGMEAVFTGTYGGLKGYQGHRADPDHRHLILGLCATA
ncbi:hypothetical protein [Nocardia sp. NPDC052566]|uniref:hypothetical protein n=1 Tax=Nocardia sp. NPDC052566 TaxID=3364330 RepID=UPI0037C73E00